MKKVDAEISKVIIAKLNHRGDLFKELTQLAENENIHLGKIEAIGAVSKAVFGYYDQNEYKYYSVELDEHLEITSLIGNISLKDGKPIVHAHVNFSDEEGKVIGGHLMFGTVIFACEAVITVYKSREKLERGFDSDTKLPLWND